MASFALPTTPADGDLYNELLNAEVSGAPEEHLFALRLHYHQVECARLERLWRESSAETQPEPPAAGGSQVVPADDRPDLTAKEVATQLRMLGTDGKPTDACYQLVKRLGFKAGKEWRIKRSSFDAFRRGET